MNDEKAIPPSRYPLAIKINSIIAGDIFHTFCDKYLSQYVARVTSMIRTPDHNLAVAGVSNSAHLHGLAIDFVLMKDGVPLTSEETRIVCETIVKPNWPDFVLFEVNPQGVYHIHANLSRHITELSTAFCNSLLPYLGSIELPINP